MTRAQRFRHLITWCALIPMLIAMLAIALSIRPAHDHEPGAEATHSHFTPSTHSPPPHAPTAQQPRPEPAQ